MPLPSGPGYIVEFPRGQSWAYLGLLLFNIYVNDIPSVVNSETLMFADDTKIFRKIQSQSDFLQFQQDISNLFAWSVKWQLKFNVSKCFIFHLGPDHFYGVII